MARNAECLQFASPGLRKDARLMRAAARENPQAAMYVQTQKLKGKRAANSRATRFAAAKAKDKSQGKKRKAEVRKKPSTSAKAAGKAKAEVRKKPSAAKAVGKAKAEVRKKPSSAAKAVGKKQRRS